MWVSATRSWDLHSSSKEVFGENWSNHLCWMMEFAPFLSNWTGFLDHCGGWIFTSSYCEKPTNHNIEIGKIDINFIHQFGSMYGIYTNIWGILMVNVTIYGIHTDPMGTRIWMGKHFFTVSSDSGIHFSCYSCYKKHATSHQVSHRKLALVLPRAHNLSCPHWTWLHLLQQRRESAGISAHSWRYRIDLASGKMWGVDPHNLWKTYAWREFMKNPQFSPGRDNAWAHRIRPKSF